MNTISTYLSILLLLFSFSKGQAQIAKRITYQHEVHFSDSTMQNLLKEFPSDEQVDLTAILSDVGKKPNNSSTKNQVEVWRTGEWVTTRELASFEGKIYKRYQVNSLDFYVIDSFTYQAEGRVDSTRYSMDFKKAKGWNVTYRIEKTSQKKTILGYPCQLYEIYESKITPQSEKPDKRMFQVWATEKIRPAISVHAVLGLYDKVLPAWTPLVIIVSSERSHGSFQKVTALSIQ